MVLSAAHFCDLVFTFLTELRCKYQFVYLQSTVWLYESLKIYCSLKHVHWYNHNDYWVDCIKRWSQNFNCLLRTVDFCLPLYLVIIKRVCSKLLKHDGQAQRCKVTNIVTNNNVFWLKKKLPTSKNISDTKIIEGSINMFVWSNYQLRRKKDSIQICHLSFYR